MNDEVMQARIALANDVYDDLVQLNQEFLSEMNRIKWQWIFSIDLFTVLYLLGKITAFEQEGIEILDALRDNPDYRESHELLTDFNHMLAHYKPMFIKYLKFSKIRSEELPEDLFNIYTYGGEV